MSYAHGPSSVMRNPRESLTNIVRGKNDLDIENPRSEFLHNSFPVIFGIKPKASRTIELSSPDNNLDNRAWKGGYKGGLVDVQIVEGVSRDEIVSIFVPARALESVEQIIKEQNLNITVSPLEPIEELYYERYRQGVERIRRYR